MYLKKVFIFILLISVLVQTMHKAVIITGYYASPEAFAKNCENKSRPQLHCNGKCQMIKQLKEEEKKEAEAFSKKGQSVEWTAPVSESNLSVLSSYSAVKYGVYHCAAITNLPSTHFHPPGISVV